MIPLGRSVSEDENVSQTISAVISHHPATLNPKTKKKGHSSVTSSTVNGNTAAGTALSSALPSQTAIDSAAVNHEVASFLINATNVLNNITVTCFGDDYAGTRDDYLRSTYKWVIKDTPVMVGSFAVGVEHISD